MCIRDSLNVIDQLDHGEDGAHAVSETAATAGLLDVYKRQGPHSAKSIKTFPKTYTYFSKSWANAK